jgi:hypothetical protein
VVLSRWIDCHDDCGCVPTSILAWKPTVASIWGKSCRVTGRCSLQHQLDLHSRQHEVALEDRMTNPQSGYPGRSRDGKHPKPKLRVGTPSPEALQAVQKRHNFPTVAKQWLQLAIQNRVIRRVLGRTRRLNLPRQLKLIQWFPYLRRFPAPVRWCRLPYRTCCPFPRQNLHLQRFTGPRISIDQGQFPEHGGQGYDLTGRIFRSAGCGQFCLTGSGHSDPRSEPGVLSSHLKNASNQ